METNILTDLMLPLSLAVIMLGMGLSLTIDDFRRVVHYPKAVAVGFLNQIILLPVTGFILIKLFGMDNLELAVGVMILASCPGGPTSNLIAHISRGDTALSITLTAISSIVTIITIPILVNFSLSYFLAHGEYVPLPLVETIIRLIIITLLPVGIGILIRSKAKNFALKMDKPVKILSGLLLFLIIFATILTNHTIFVQSFRDVGLITLTLNLAMLIIGYITSRIFALNVTQSITISIETGIQNGTLGIMIASTLLHNNVMAISPAVYSLIMFMTAGFIIGWMNLKVKNYKLVVR